MSAAIPACRRGPQLRTTLLRIHSCYPAPAEILVHLDGDDAELRSLVEMEFPKVRLLSSELLIGPGGARNRLMQESRHSWVANFDDDSFPLDLDYFARAWKLISDLPEAAVFCASILPSEVLDPESLWLQAYYPGCGNIINRKWFLKTKGYQMLPIAYNMEEVDVSMQLRDLGGLCLQSGRLRVFHDHIPAVREEEKTQIEVMINTVIFPFLRFPLLLLPQAFASVCRRLFRLAMSGEWLVIRGVLLRLPSAILRYWPSRAPVRFSTALNWLVLRRNPILVRALHT